jgi:protein-S-isoprenylcysteine O-methyltransferase Ste14
MKFRPDVPAEVVFCVVAVCWIGFGGILFFGKKGAAKVEKKRDLKSHFGFLLQCLAYAICFTFYRPYFSPFVAMSRAWEVVLAGVTIAIAIASEWLCFAAARALGRQWALVARVIEGHELIEQGPYALVRNPIYLAMIGMLLAIGMAVSRWPALVAALVVFFAGNEIRIRSEEKLLREAFGAKFDGYARRVPSVFPRLL